MFLPELGQQVARPLDRPRNQLGEKADIQRIIAQMPFCRQVASIDINNIAQRLKGIKADPHRKHQLECRKREGKSRKAQQAAQAFGGKIIIFEEKQHREAEPHPNADNHPTGCLSPEPAEDEARRPADQNREEDQQDQLRIPAHIKIKAEDKQYRPPHPMGQQIINNTDHRQKNRITQRVKQHLNAHSP